MDRGARWATVYGVAESDTTERPSLSLQPKARTACYGCSHNHMTDYARLFSLATPVVTTLNSPNFFTQSYFCV